MFEKFKENFPQLKDKWDEYVSYYHRIEAPAGTILLKEGEISKKAFMIEKKCLRLWLLKDLGADTVIDLKQPDEKFVTAFQKEAGETGYDVVIDFIWGHPAEMIMKSLVPKEAGFAKKRIRYVHVGEKAGSVISLSGEMLRTSGLEIYGTGNIPHEAIPEAMKQVWQWIKENKFYVDIEKVSLAGIEKAWLRNDLEGKRLVIVP